jgi:hypothetical protein
MHVKHKRSFASDGNERTKRRKSNEEQYAASVAKEDMKKGGVTIRPIETERSRIALGKVDMSRVKLVRSKELESPFLVPASPHMASIKYDFTAESVYNTLINSCRRAYELLDAIDTDAIESDSSDSTSSFSDVESDFGQAGWKRDPAVIIKPRVEDTIRPATTNVSEPCPSTMFVEQQTSPPPEVSMTMDEALTVCKFSRCVAIECTVSFAYLTGPSLTLCFSHRLMTLAVSPYTVVHSNAAYGQLTGLSSANILGKPLFNSLGDSNAPTLARCAESSAAGKDVEFSILGNDSKPIECHMKVTPIVSSVHSSLKVTHYAVDLTALGAANDEASLQAVAQQAASNDHRLATTVVG